MPDQSFPIIQTRFHVPPLTSDFVPRPRLVERLEAGAAQTLSLVCTPPGYGKSTLLASWVAESVFPFAWLSLEQGDGDLRAFLHYVVAATRTLYPDALVETRAMLSGTELPGEEVLGTCLVNELCDLPRRFVLTLDDYHVIHDESVHKLIGYLLGHPPPTLHITIASRYDPPLPLTSLRARGQITELRAVDLRFSERETDTFLRNTSGRSLDTRVVTALEEKTEGWATGLRLAALSLPYHETAEAFIAALGSASHSMTEYFVDELLTKQPEPVLEYLLAAAVPSRFCAMLCEEILGDGAAGSDLSGDAFIEWARGNNLFIIPLDAEHRWFRFHHLFRDLLLRRLRQIAGSDRIADLHVRASRWFAVEGLAEEAFEHALSSDRPGLARTIVEDRYRDLMNRENWPLLRRWLRRLPAEEIAASADLSMAQAWCQETRHELDAAAESLDRVEQQLSEATPTLIGEYHALRSRLRFEEADAGGAIESAERSLELLSSNDRSARGMAVLILALARQMRGNRNAAHQLLLDELVSASTKQDTFHARVLAGRCFLQWIDADAKGLQRTAEAYLKVGTDGGLTETIALGRYFSGIALYDLDRVDEAKPYLTDVVAHPYAASAQNFAQSAWVLALCRCARGAGQEAEALVHSVVPFGLESGTPVAVELARSFQAELSLRQGRSADASAWAEGFSPEPLHPWYRFHLPQLAYAKWLVLSGERESQRARDLLERMDDYYTSIHNRRVLIDVLLLRSLLDKDADEASLAALERALELAAPGGVVRPFLDLGSDVPVLLQRLVREGRGNEFVGRLLSAFRGAAPVSAGAASRGRSKDEGDLTKREREVLALLERRLSNHEIAERLFISAGTVKRHTLAIYQKLHVGGRRAAVSRARELGLLEEV